jgi:hypothetical protein
MRRWKQAVDKKGLTPFRGKNAIELDNINI